MDILNEEKKALKNRIMRSVQHYRRRKKRQRIGMISACVILVLAVSGWWYGDRFGSSPVYKYALTLPENHPQGSGEIELLLGKGDRIALGAADSTIAYSRNGQQVTIGNSKTVEQGEEEEGAIAYNTLTVPYGKRSRVVLSDSTVVWLNSGSRLVYPVAFSGNTREVYLEGEGIFEVAHNKEKPFMVLADNHRIRVLGTVFNVSNYAEDKTLKTVLKSGSVAVEYKGTGILKQKQTIRIEPGTMTVYEKSTGRMISEKVNIEDYFSWKEGVLILRNCKLGDIVKKLSRYYNIAIEIGDEDLAKETFSGYLDLKESVESVISTIGKTTDIRYFATEENNKWIINQK